MEKQLKRQKGASLLTAWTIIRTALRLHYSANSRAAAAAGLALPAVDGKPLHLKNARSISDRLSQGCDNSSSEPSQFVGAQTFRLATWIDSGPPERFAGVNVAYAGNQPLIQQRNFHGA